MGTHSVEVEDGDLGDGFRLLKVQMHVPNGLSSPFYLVQCWPVEWQEGMEARIHAPAGEDPAWLLMDCPGGAAGRFQTLSLAVAVAKASMQRFEAVWRLGGVDASDLYNGWDGRARVAL